MAVITEYLTPIQRYESPYWDKSIANGDVTLIGTDSLFVRGAGYTPDGKPHIFSIEAAIFNLTTDATVADRNCVLYVWSEEGFFIGKWLFDDQAASATAIKHGLYPICNAYAAAPASSWCGIPGSTLMIIGNGYINAAVLTGKAGDSWQLQLRLKYMNYELGLIAPSDNPYIPPVTPPETTFPPRRFIDP